MSDNKPYKRRSSFDVSFNEGDEWHAANSLADDDVDESIISSLIDETSVLNGIGNMAKIASIRLQIAVTDGIDARKFTFSRTWIVLRTIGKLGGGPLAHLNVEYLVAYTDLSVEDLLLGLMVLHHLGVDTNTFLKERRDLLDGSDCSSIKSSDQKQKTGPGSRLMTALLNCVVNKPIADNKIRLQSFNPESWRMMRH